MLSSLQGSEIEFDCRRTSATAADGRVGMGEQPISLRRASLTGVKDNVARIPGIGLMYADSIYGVPPVFTHLLTNLPAIYQIVVFVTVRHAATQPLFSGKEASRLQGLLTCLHRAERSQCRGWSPRSGT